MSKTEENPLESETDIILENSFITYPTENHNVKSNWITHFSGIAYSLTASALFTCATFFVQRLEVDLLDALLFRFVIQTITYLAFGLWKRYDILGGTTKEIILQIVCSCAGSTVLFLFFIAIRYIELSDAITLSYTRVVWTILSNIIISRERPSIGVIIALPLTILGVVFVTEPKFIFSSKTPIIITTDQNVNGTSRFIGFLLALGCALTSTVNVLLFKQLISTSRDIKPSILNLQFSAISLIGLIINQIYKIVYSGEINSFVNMLSWTYFLSGSICLLSILGSIFVQKAIKRENPDVFSLLGSADIIFSLILQNLFTKTRSNSRALLGSGFVILSVFIIGISRYLETRSKHRNLQHLPKQ